jgi:hypothetical protein
MHTKGNAHLHSKVARQQAQQVSNAYGAQICSAVLSTKLHHTACCYARGMPITAALTAVTLCSCRLAHCHSSACCTGLLLLTSTNSPVGQNMPEKADDMPLQAQQHTGLVSLALLKPHVWCCTPSSVHMYQCQLHPTSPNEKSC